MSELATFKLKVTADKTHEILHLKPEPMDTNSKPNTNNNSPSNNNNNSSSWYCDACCNTFKSKQDLLTDIDKHFRFEICKECNLHYLIPMIDSTKKCYDSHQFITDYYRNNILKCNHCAFVTIIANDLKRHINEHNSMNNNNNLIKSEPIPDLESNNALCCVICNVTFVSKQDLLKDIAKHCRYEKCSQCNKSYSVKDARKKCFTIHAFISKYYSNDMYLMCMHCKFNANNANELTNHYLIQHGTGHENETYHITSNINDFYTYYPNTATTSTTTTTVMDVDVHNRLPQLDSFCCLICNFTFESGEQLYKDVNKHCRYEKCSVCDQEYSKIMNDRRKKCYDIHAFISKFQSIDVYLKCKNCPFEAHNATQLTNHYMSKHSTGMYNNNNNNINNTNVPPPPGLELLDCMICSKEMYGQKELKKLLHFDKHSRDICSDCNNIFGAENKNGNKSSKCYDKHDFVWNKLQRYTKLKCQKCEYITVIRDKFDSHQQTHSDVSISIKHILIKDKYKDIQCQICYDKHNTQALAVSDFDHHSREICKICDITFGTKISVFQYNKQCYNKHKFILDKLQKFKQLKCNQCSYYTILHNNFNKHKLCHTQFTMIKTEVSTNNKLEINCNIKSKCGSKKKHILASDMDLNQRRILVFCQHFKYGTKEYCGVHKELRLKYNLKQVQHRCLGYLDDKKKITRTINTHYPPCNLCFGKIQCIRHTTQIEKEQYYKNCKQDIKTFKDKIFISNDEHSCIQCNKSFKSGVALGGHMASVHTKRSKKRKLKTNIIGSDSSSDSDKILVDKNNDHDEKTQSVTGTGTVKILTTEYKCIECNKIFKSPQALGGHNSAKHSKIRKANILKLEKSQDNMNIENRGEYSCLKCGKSFKSGVALGGHMTSAHSRKNIEKLSEKNDSKKKKDKYKKYKKSKRKIVVTSSENDSDEMDIYNGNIKEKTQMTSNRKNDKRSVLNKFVKEMQERKLKRLESKKKKSIIVRKIPKISKIGKIPKMTRIPKMNFAPTKMNIPKKNMDMDMGFMYMDMEQSMSPSLELSLSPEKPTDISGEEPPVLPLPHSVMMNMNNDNKCVINVKRKRDKYNGFGNMNVNGMDRRNGNREPVVKRRKFTLTNDS